MAREAADEVAGTGGREGDDIIPGVEGGDWAADAARVVAGLVDLEDVVCLRRVFEDDLVAWVEVPGGSTPRCRSWC